MYLLSFEESDVEDGWEVVDELQGKQFDGDAVIVVCLCTQTFPVCQMERKSTVHLWTDGI